VRRNYFPGNQGISRSAEDISREITVFPGAHKFISRSTCGISRRGGGNLKQDRPFTAVTVNKKGERALKGGHPWVYAEELTQTVPEDFSNGGLVDVISQSGKYLGTGFFSAKSKIAVRVLSDNANERFGPDFWDRRVGYALDYRKRVMGADFVDCRLIFGEADGFPGLTVDRFGNYLSAEVLSYGMDLVKDIIFKAIIDRIPEIEGIYLRNESRIRDLEGLPRESGWYEGIPHSGDGSTVIEENGIRYRVDFAEGQKTGFFLDQKYNRQAAGRLARGLRVLDVCTHTGSFALNALKGGAVSANALDVSASALETAAANMALNPELVTDSAGNPKMQLIKSDAFDYLETLTGKAPQYDFIILDPPAFTKSSGTLKNAQKGYKELNYLAMRALPRGGCLATCSCSHFMTTELFLDMLKEASLEAGVKLKIIEIRHQAPDHPVLLNVPETDYLKFVICQIV